MLLQSIYTKLIRDRIVGLAIAVASLALVSWMGVAVYASIGDSAVGFLESMPEGFLAITGISLDLGGAGLILSEMANLLAPVVLVGLAVAIGADAVAGEERWGTVGLLLANPRGRTRVVVEKALALATVALLGVIGAWTGYRFALWADGASADDVNLVASSVHLLALVLFMGALTFCIGAWTGDTLKANLTGAAVLLVTMFSAPLLADSSWGSWASWLMPWHYLNAAEPLRHGVHWGHVAILGLGALALFVAAWAGVRRRDLKAGEARVTIVDRLKQNPRVGKVMERIAGRTQVSSISSKAISDGQSMVTIVGAVMLYMGGLLGPMFNPAADKVTDFVEDFPDWILAMVGNVTYSTPAEWYHGEVYSLMAPAAAVVVGVAAAARALAGEERARTMGVLLANPVTRTRVVLDKALAMVALVVGVSIFTGAGVALGSVIVQLDISYVNILAATVHMVALGVAIGSVALFVGALTGLSRAAIGAATGVMIASWFAATILPINESLGGYAQWSPFYYYANLHQRPLIDGVAWDNVGVLAAIAAVFVAASVWAFRRRDLRG